MFDKEVVDATSTLEFKIRRPDVDGGVDRNPEACVVARAVKRTLNGTVGRVKIGAAYAYVEYPTHVERFRVSDETRQMIRGYDKGGFYPTGVTAKLTPVPPTRRLGATKPTGPRSNRGKSGKTNVRSQSTPWLRHAMQDVNA